MKKVVIILTVVALIFPLLITFAACAPGPGAGETIKIAYISSITGPMAGKLLHMTHGVELAVKEINAAGGILGKQVEMLTYDPRSVPEEAVTLTNKAIFDDKVKALVGFEDSSLSLPSLPIAIKAGIPFVNTMSIHRDLVRQPGELGFISTNITNRQCVEAQCAFAENVLGIKSVVAIGPDNAWLWDCYEWMRQTWERPGSPVKVIDTIGYPIGATDITPVIMKAVGYKPDLIWSFDWSVTLTGEVFRKLAEAGYTGQQMQHMPMLIPPVIEAGGEAIEGTWGMVTWGSELANPESEAFELTLVNEYGPQVWGEMSDVTATGYMGMKSLLLAMEKAGSDTDLAAIDKAFFDIDWVTPLGYKWELDETGWLVWRDVYMTQVQNGQNVIVATIPKYK